MRRIALVIALLLPLAACNTVEGIGKDLQKGGEVIADTAKDVKEGK